MKPVHTLDLVVLGVDFHSSRHLRPRGQRDPAAYLERAGVPRYLVGSLLSLELLRRSLVTAARSAGASPRPPR